MMGATSWRGLVVGLIGNVLIGVSLFHLIQVGSCGNGYDGACPSSLTPYFIALPVGILTSVAGIFMGGGVIAFCGVFVSIGLGALAAGWFGDGKTGAFYIFGGMFAFFGLLPLLLGAGLRRIGAGKEAQAMRLVATGAQGVGTVTHVQDTGITINDNPRVEVTMRVQPVDGGAPLERRKTVTVSRVAIPRVADRFPVWYDRADAGLWAFGVDMEPHAPPEVKALFARAGRGEPAAPAAAAEPDRPSPLEELERLNELRKVGAVTNAEYENAKAVLLARLGNPGRA
ncbi:MAG: hypothetical protein QOI38_2973 [Sphingomonadales bacterium]|jgi:membrane protein implicated in regulation of membrane protease activity|nr:hypothetical protein [Sphingomonadales bacterium]